MSLFYLPCQPPVGNHLVGPPPLISGLLNGLAGTFGAIYRLWPPHDGE
jgi:hypothetical protein